MYLTLSELEKLAERVDLKIRVNTEAGILEKLDQKSERAEFVPAPTDTIMRTVMSRLYENSQKDAKPQEN